MDSFSLGDDGRACGRLTTCLRDEFLVEGWVDALVDVRLRLDDVHGMASEGVRHAGGEPSE